MKLTWLDISIVLLYLGSMVTIGWVLRKKARQNKESYLMGGKSLPWYLLGLSDASDMFDISGTMWMVALCFIYGMKSIWIPWLWPVFNQVFLMMYLSKWLRRSNATTGAEWLATRFGKRQKCTCIPHQCGHICFAGMFRFPGLRICRPGEIHGNIHSMEFSATLFSISCFACIRSAYLWHHIYPVCYILFGDRRYA